MRFRVVHLLLCLTMTSSGLFAGTPSAKLDGSLESRADRAFVNGDYAAALPLLRAVADRTQDDPAKLDRVLERIRVCEKSLAANTKQIPIAPGERKPHTPPPDGQVAEMSIKELGNFTYDPEKGGIPDDVKRLSGSKIRLTGFMIPLEQADKITRFALVPSLFSCCFGQPPQVQHVVNVTCPENKPVSYSPDQVVVEGTLGTEEKKEDGYVVSIFQLAATSVAPAAK